VERTEFETTGRVLDLGNETVFSSKASRNYTNWLPGVYLRHEATKNLVFRTSWSNSLARPSFSDTAFRSLVNNDDLEITRGNPNLKALESVNWDASVEYYLPSLGLLSAAVFHKEIKNFSYELEDPTPLVINGESYDLTTYANGSEGSITGLELAYQQQSVRCPRRSMALASWPTSPFWTARRRIRRVPARPCRSLASPIRSGTLG